MENFKKVIGTIDPSKKTIVWGAGISGLLIAYYLKKNNIKVSVKERENFAGGKISSSQFHHNTIEQGPNALYLNEEAYDLLKDLNLLDKIIIPPKKLKRYIFLHKKIISVLCLIPYYSLMRYLFSSTPKFRLDMSLADFIQPWIGEYAVKNLIDPALSGIYAIKSSEISLFSLFPFNESTYPANYWQFLKSLRKQKLSKEVLPIKGSISFKGGMKTLIDALVNELAGDINFNTNDRLNTTENNNIICTDVESAITILNDFPDWVSALKMINYNSISSNTLLLKKEIKSLQNAFGILFADNIQNANSSSLGILANHNIFKLNYPTLYSYTLIGKKTFRNHDELIADLKLLDFSLEKSDIEHYSSFNWEKGLPVYNYQRYQAISILHELSNHQKGLCLFGNYVAGISIREMIMAAKDFANKSS